MEGIVSWFEFVVDNLGAIWTSTLEHIVLVFVPVVAAIVVSVGIGILFRHNPLVQNINLSIAAVLLTIPSLALFTITIPIFGLGFWPPVLALFLYSILPILRNTATGLAGVDSAVLESAKGVGMGPRTRLWKVELPLAWPVILAGIRVSVLLSMGIAAIATLVAAGGLGDFIKDGLARFPLPTSVERIWTGTVFIIILALISDQLLGFAGRLTTSKGIQK